MNDSRRSLFRTLLAAPVAAALAARKKPEPKVEPPPEPVPEPRPMPDYYVPVGMCVSYGTATSRFATAHTFDVYVKTGMWGLRETRT